MTITQTSQVRDVSTTRSVTLEPHERDWVVEAAAWVQGGGLFRAPYRLRRRAGQDDESEKSSGESSGV